MHYGSRDSFHSPNEETSLPPTQFDPRRQFALNGVGMPLRMANTSLSEK